MILACSLECPYSASDGWDAWLWLLNLAGAATQRKAAPFEPKSLEFYETHKLPALRSRMKDMVVLIMTMCVPSMT